MKVNVSKKSNSVPFDCIQRGQPFLYLEEEYHVYMRCTSINTDFAGGGYNAVSLHTGNLALFGSKISVVPLPDAIFNAYGDNQ